ncbi:MAG TPA: quinonprotein alcohol dehydrogenase, partial [Burkholderiaceae bacterium]|nr:quinonprotein alcohol dehydrogenase [Burkholderiaceae bacterium]
MRINGARLRACVWLGCAMLALGSTTSWGQEVQGAGGVTGSPVPRDVSVTQARLDGAARDSANFL